MKKILFIVLSILCFAGVVVATQQSFSGSLKALTIASTDTLIASGNIDLDTSATFTALWIPSGTAYTCLSSGTNRFITLTGSGFFFKDSSTGTKTYADSIIHTTGSGTAIISSLSGSISATSTAWNFSGINDSFKGYLAVNAFKGIRVGKNTTLAKDGSGSSTYRYLLIDSGAIYNSITGANYRRITTGKIISVGQNAQIIGSATITLWADGSGITDTIEGFQFITGDVNMQSSSGATTVFTGNVNLGTRAYSHNASTSTGTNTVNYNGFNVTAGNFSYGASGASGTAIFNFRSGIFDFVALTGASLNSGTIIDSFHTATIKVATNYTNGSAHTIVPGTASWVFDSSTAGTITSSNKPFYNFKIAKISSAAVTLVDSLTVMGDLVDTLGKFKTAGFNVNLSGDFYRYSADSALWSTSTITLNKANTLWYRRTAGLSAPVGGMASATMRAINGARFDVDTNMTVYRLVSTANKKLQFTAGRIFKDSTYTSGDLNNDTLQSLTGGSKAYLNLPANTSITDAWIKDIFAINTIYDTASTGLNGGNDSNVVFKYATATYARSPTIVVVSSASPSSVPIAGGTLDTLTGTGFYPPCSVSIAGGSYVAATFIDTTKISFTTPASTAGVKSVTVKNGDFKTGSGSVLTYTSVTVTPVIDSVRPYWTAISMAAQKRGATFKIRGTGFKATQGTGTVYLGSSDLLTAATWSDTLIIDTIPITWTPKGTYNLITKNSDNQRDTSQIRVLIPTITPMTP